MGVRVPHLPQLNLNYTQRPIVLKYWRIIRYKTLIIQCVPEGKPKKRFCYESFVGKPCAFTGKACTDFKCIDRADGIRVKYIKVDYRVYVNRI